MKEIYLILLTLSFLVGCSSTRQPAETPDVVVLEKAGGNVVVTAKKSERENEICFDIQLNAKNVDDQYVKVTNWSVAWQDNVDHYHLMTLNQRNPASVPEKKTVVAQYGQYDQSSQHFVTCAPTAKLKNFKSLVLTPKQSPYPGKKEIILTWNNL